MPPVTVIELDPERALAAWRGRIGRRSSHPAPAVDGLEPPRRRDLFACGYAAMRVLVRRGENSRNPVDWWS